MKVEYKKCCEVERERKNQKKKGRVCYDVTLQNMRTSMYLICNDKKGFKKVTEYKQM